MFEPLNKEGYQQANFLWDMRRSSIERDHRASELVLWKYPDKRAGGKICRDVFLRQKRDSQARQRGFAKRQRAVGIEQPVHPDRTATLSHEGPDAIVFVRTEMRQAGIICQISNTLR